MKLSMAMEMAKISNLLSIIWNKVKIKCYNKVKYPNFIMNLYEIIKYTTKIKYKYWSNLTT